jgi:hypothetical protein
MVDYGSSTQTLRVIFRPSFFIDDESLYDIYDDFPESVGDVREEEIMILLPFLLRQIMAVIDDESGYGSTLCEGQHR